MAKSNRRKRGEQRQGICVYCGAEGPITDDHVFPQAIFLVLDEQMVTVPSCEACQQIKSLGDRDLKNFITMDIGGSQHPDALAMAERMLKESNVRLRAWVRKQLEDAREVELVTDTGLIVGKAIEFEFNTDRIVVAQEMAVRGLYFHEKRMMLPMDCPIDVQHIPWQAAPRFVQDMSKKASMSVRVKGKNVVWWSAHPIRDRGEEDTAWHVCYNNWVLFFGTTGEAALTIRRQREAFRQQQTTNPKDVAEGPKRVIVPRDLQGRPMIPPQ